MEHHKLTPAANDFQVQVQATAVLDGYLIAPTLAIIC